MSRAMDMPGAESGLHEAVRQGNLEEIGSLLERGADVNAKTTFGETPLHKAAYQGHVGVAQLLIERGAGVNATNDEGNTALHLAAEEGKAAVVALLLSRGGTRLCATNTARRRSTLQKTGFTSRQRRCCPFVETL